MNASNPIVLMYHAIKSARASFPMEREVGAELYDVSHQDFNQQMEFLKSNNYSVMTLEDQSMDQASPSVIITFDDGEMNNIEWAFPMLKEYQFPAYFFVTVNRVGKKGYMGWEQLLELRDSGMILGSHGLNHEIMTNLKEKEIERELVDSKEILEQHLKIELKYFSVPRGFCDTRIIALAKQCGYRNIFVSGMQKDSDPFCVDRIAVKGDWTLERFTQALKQKIPFQEKFSDWGKNLGKGVLGVKRYDQLRTMLLKRKK